jgi:hypothetical protein
MTTLIVVLVALGSSQPGVTAYGVAPCVVRRGEPS